MKKLNELVTFISGSAQFRITEAFNDDAPLYHYYNQTNLSDDLVGMISDDVDEKNIRTLESVNTVNTNDIIFSLISGTATIVRKEHEGYLFTQNYIKLIPKESIDSKFLIYMLNENRVVKKQLVLGLQGSKVMKYTLRQLNDLEFPRIPKKEKQILIGEIYFNTKRLEALRDRVIKSETKILMSELETLTKEESK